MCDDVLDLTDSPVPQRKATHANANGNSTQSSSSFRHNSGIFRGVPDQSDEEDHFETAASQSCAKKKSVSASKKRGVDPEKLAQREATEANKVAKKEAAEALKRQKEIEKERKRLEKESIQLQKEARTEERRIAAQMSGKHKDSEVSLIIEDRLYNSQEGLAIIDHLRQQTGEKERPIQFLPAPSRIPNLLRWTFRSLSDGGGCNIGEPKCRVMEFAVVLMPVAEYIQLATDTDDSIDFDALGAFVDETRRKAAVTEGCPDHCRLTILLNDLDKEVNKMARSKNNATSISGLQAALAALDGAEAYLIAEKGVDVWKVKSAAEIAEYLKSVTQQLAEAIYKEPTTELECVAKKSVKVPEGLSGREKEIHELRETWINMLQTIPGISDKSARALASHYSCPRKLLDAYHSKTLTLEEKYNLLSDKFGLKGERRKLSRKVYELMTTFDPNLMIDDV